MQSQSFRLLGRSVLAMAMAPEPPLATWFRELDGLIQGSPGFFAGRPIILDAAQLAEEGSDLRAVIDQLNERGIRVMAIEGVDGNTLGRDLPPVVSGARDSGVLELTGKPKQAVATVSEPPPEPDVLLIDRPIRSGQSVYYHSDVTIIGSVASGAEIVAGGSIHVYGALRGRAIAGSIGNADARVFCSKLEAELIAINGLYQTADDMPARLRGRAAQVRLRGDAISMAELN
jgi:septum site-determining protein MinC